MRISPLTAAGKTFRRLAGGADGVVGISYFGMPYETECAFLARMRIGAQA